MAIVSDDNKNINKPLKRNPVVKPDSIEYDKTFENSIRPKDFDSYIGQSSLKETLKITLEAAKRRNKPLDHLLFYGPPGLGKTTIAGVIAAQMGVDIKITSAPALERPRDIIGILMSLKGGEILFIDEIHRLNKVAEEILYPAMEDFTLDMTTGKSQTAKTLRIPIPKFTLIGATTKAGELSGPLRDRFGMIHRLEFYTVDELAQVVMRTARILEIDITETNESLDILKIDKYGLDTTDRALLNLIIEKYDGGPVGIETIAAALSEDVRTIEDVCEPYLLQAGFLQRTPRGRKVSPEGYRHLGVKQPSCQTSLFDM